jgi:hypothetical protein
LCRHPRDDDRPLVDALIQAGIPREKIVLAYLGEAVNIEDA